MTDSPNKSPMQGDRIAKVLARAGVASRREAERMILAGRVKVNGKTLSSAAMTVTDTDAIMVDDVPLAPKEPPRLWRYHKPPGMMTTHNDPEGRPTVFENLPAGMPRVISVGRLDMNSEGLLLLTNDGELARQLELPATAWARKYRARAYGRITQEQLDTLQKGIKIDGVPTGPIEAVLETQKGDNAWIAVTIREGKNREVRRALDSLGLSVNRLIRVAYGPFQLGTLAKHEVDEVQRRILRDQVGHFIDIPTGRPDTNRSVLKEKVKSNIKHVPRSKAGAKRVKDKADGNFEDIEYRAPRRTPDAPAKSGKAKNAKQSNAKWGKEKSAAMRAAKDDLKTTKSEAGPAGNRKSAKPKKGWAKPAPKGKAGSKNSASAKGPAGGRGKPNFKGKR